MGVSEDLKEFVIALGIAVLIYITLGWVLHTSMPVVTVVSDSMLPILHVGDLLLVENINEPQVGDIVVYKVSVLNYPIVHRIVGKKFVNGTNVFIMKGDHNPSEDPFLVERKDIIGRVFFAIPMLGYPRYLLYLPFKAYDMAHFVKS